MENKEEYDYPVFLGEVAVDTGQITIGDPCVIEGKMFEEMKDLDWAVTFPTDLGDGIYAVFHDQPGVWTIIDTDLLGGDDE